MDETLLIFAAFMGGLIDSIAGGGGIITIPALLAVGVPPHFALGTNKLQALLGSFTATFNYRRKGLLSIQELKWAILFTAIGAAVGTIVVQWISANFLKNLIPILLVVLFIYLLVSPRLGIRDQKARITKGIYYLIFGIILGFYDGFFGPGTGSFWTISMILLLGINLKRATAQTKVMNFTSNIIALIFFVVGGKVLFKYGIMMWPGQILGAWIGSKLVIKYDTSFIRFVLMGVTGATILYMLIKT